MFPIDKKHLYTTISVIGSAIVAGLTLYVYLKKVKQLIIISPPMNNTFRLYFPGLSGLITGHLEMDS